MKTGEKKFRFFEKNFRVFAKRCCSTTSGTTGRAVYPKSLTINDLC